MISKTLDDLLDSLIAAVSASERYKKPEAVTAVKKYVKEIHQHVAKMRHADGEDYKTRLEKIARGPQL
jgi:hypothetical protein